MKGGERANACGGEGGEIKGRQKRMAESGDDSPATSPLSTRFDAVRRRFDAAGYAPGVTCCGIRVSRPQLHKDAA